MKVEEYLKLPYNYIIQQITDESGTYFYAKVLELDGCQTTGATFEEAYISDAQLEWLDSEIAAENGKPTFVICHQPLKLTHDLPNTWGNGTNLNAGSVGDQSDEIKEILTKYENVVFITGHLHTGFGDASYETIDNLHIVNVPALSIDNKDGKYNGSGLGYIVEVYDEEIIFRARNLETGEWLTDYNEVITIKK